MACIAATLEESIRTFCDVEYDSSHAECAETVVCLQDPVPLSPQRRAAVDWGTKSEWTRRCPCRAERRLIVIDDNTSAFKNPESSALDPTVIPGLMYL